MVVVAKSNFRGAPTTKVALFIAPERYVTVPMSEVAEGDLIQTNKGPLLVDDVRLEEGKVNLVGFGFVVGGKKDV